MRRVIVIAGIFAFGPLSPISAQERSYEAPPSKSTFGSVPTISDAAMEQCVKLYNDGKWLLEELKNAKVDRYSQAAVDAYNAKVVKHGAMVDRFNRDCAGKQSESAARAARELNKKK